jgi:crotonobetainyl-CoA:carnitine CoA-transferase CaiB-like acyl-CoA transferase
MRHEEAGAIDLVASPLRLSGTPADYRLPPPLLGEHTEEILKAVLAMQPAEIERLRAAKVI